MAFNLTYTSSTIVHNGGEWKVRVRLANATIVSSIVAILKYFSWKEVAHIASIRSRAGEEMFKVI